ncbi:Protein SODIUM POTASSIUM ROOT DEFECTIVE 1 [Bienertia sinuspersici]
MSAKNNKMRLVRGFMCQSPASTAVGCMPDDIQAVVVPSKSSERSSMVVNSNHDLHERTLRNVKYCRLNNNNDRENLLPLGDHRNSIKRDHHHHRDQPSVAHQKHQKPKNLQRTSLSSDEIFQVVVLRVSLHCQGCAGKLKNIYQGWKVQFTNIIKLKTVLQIIHCLYIAPSFTNMGMIIQDIARKARLC